ncbi:MAG: phosphoribosylformylglycinamidine synthase subunit PurS, partial [Planctomycetaceae bacterium]
MLWEIEIRPSANQVDREGLRVLHEGQSLGTNSIRTVQFARSFLIQGDADAAAVERIASSLLVDTVVETYTVHKLNGNIARGLSSTAKVGGPRLLNVLFKPGVTDNVAASTKAALAGLGQPVDAVATCRKYWLNADADPLDVDRLAAKVLANDAIEQVVRGPLVIDNISLGNSYEFKLQTVPIRGMNDEQLAQLSRDGQLFLNPAEMQTIRRHFVDLGRDPTDIELETIAQTWSEHCSHKTLTGRIHYRDEQRDLKFD